MCFVSDFFVDEVVQSQLYFEGSDLFPRWIVDGLAAVQLSRVVHLHEDAVVVPGLAGALPVVHPQVLVLKIIF